MDMNFKNEYKDKFKNIFRKEGSLLRPEKSEIKIALIAVAAMIILSIAIYGYTRIFYPDLIYSLTPFQILMASVAGKLKVSTVGSLSFFSNKIEIGIISFIIVNFAVIMFSNIFVYKRKRQFNTKEVFITSSKIGFYYAVVMSIISVFSGIKIQTGMGGMFGSVYLSIGYTFSSVFINSFVIAFLSSIAANWRKEFCDENGFINLVCIVLKYSLYIFIILTIISTLTILLKPTILSGTGILKYPMWISIPQLAAYLFIISLGGTVSILSMNISIFNILSGSISIDLKLMTTLVCSTIAIIIFVKGYNMHDEKKIKHISLISAFVSAFISKVSSINVDISNIGVNLNVLDKNILYSSDSVISFILSFIFVFVFLKIGYILNSDKKYTFKKKEGKGIFKNTKKDDEGQRIYDVDFKEVDDSE